ncbi:MAG: hypothetical protein ACJ75H_02700 [Thermoanaerobaculia bacterium]
MKKLALLLLLLAALAITAFPALALPPQCSCTYCTLHGGSNCTLIRENVAQVVTCGYYYPTYCSMPN